jgi:hypothetical protein
MFKRSAKEPADQKAQKPLWKRAARALLLPWSAKQIGVYLAAWFVAWPLLGAAIFPRAEKAVEEQGLDPKIVQELAPGKNVYIRTDDALGKAHTMLDRGPLALPLVLWQNIYSNEGGHSRNGFLTSNDIGVCMVYLRASDYKNAPREHYQRALLHEIRHCSNDNVNLMRYGVFDTVAAEGDADAKGLTVLARETKNPELKQQFLGLLAIDGSPADQAHNTALYLDAVFNNRAIPSNEAIAAANAEAETQRGSIIARTTAHSMSDAVVRQGFPALRETSEAFKKDCNFDIAAAHLSPLGQRRAELMAEGYRRELHFSFDPDKNNIPRPAPKPGPKPKA